MKVLLLFLVTFWAYSGEVILTWNPPVEPVDGYILHWSDKDGVLRTLETSTTTTTLGGLTHGSRYNFWVTATFVGIESAPSNHLNGTFINTTLQQSDDLTLWSPVFTRGDIVETPRHFYRLSMGHE